MKRIKYYSLAILLVCLLVWILLPAAVNPAAVPEDRDFVIYASSEPARMMTEMIIAGVPGMSVSTLTQPQENGYEEYSLSDWELALLEDADIFVMLGNRFEGFSGTLQSDKTIFISVLGSLKLKSVSDYACRALDYTGDEVEADIIPYSYLSLDGMINACEALCANFTVADEAYASEYLQNLNEVYDYIGELKEASGVEQFSGNHPVAVACEASLYLLDDVGIEPGLIIRRNIGQELDDQEMAEICEQLAEEKIDTLICESQMPESNKKYFENNGIKLITIDLMFTKTDNNGADAYGEFYRRNLNKLTGGMPDE